MLLIFNHFLSMLCFCLIFLNKEVEIRLQETTEDTSKIQTQWDSTKTNLRDLAEEEALPREIREQWSKFRGYFEGVSGVKPNPHWWELLQSNYEPLDGLDSGTKYESPWNLAPTEIVKLKNHRFKVESQSAFDNGSIALLGDNNEEKWSVLVPTTFPKDIRAASGTPPLTRWQLFELSPDEKYLYMWCFNDPGICVFQKISMERGETELYAALEPLERVYRKELKYLKERDPRKDQHP